MKHIVYICLTLLTVGATHAQSANRDSLIIRSGNTWICIGMHAYAQPYDAVFAASSQRILSMMPAACGLNGLPPDIRYIRAANGAEFLKCYNEPEPETENWALQVERMQHTTGPQAVYPWKCRVSDLHTGMLFTVYAPDSASMRTALLTNLQTNFAARATSIEAAAGRNEDPWLVQLDESGGDPLIQVHKRRFEHYGVRAFTGPALFGDQLAVGFGGELNRMFYRNQLPAFRLGITTATYFSNFTGEIGRWNSMSILQFKFVKPRGEDKPWYGVKLGVGGLETGAFPLFQSQPAQVVQLTPSGPIMLRLPFWSLGFSLENTPLADFDIDFMVITSRHSIVHSRQGLPVMLSVKLPF